MCVWAEEILPICSDRLVVSLHCFNMHGMDCLMISFISIHHEKSPPVVWHTNILCNHLPDTLVSLGSGECFQAGACRCPTLYRPGRPSLAEIVHIVIIFSGHDLGFTTCWANHVYYNLSGMIQSHYWSCLWLSGSFSKQDQPFPLCGVESHSEIAMSGNSEVMCW